MPPPRRTYSDADDCVARQHNRFHRNGSTYILSLAIGLALMMKWLLHPTKPRGSGFAIPSGQRVYAIGDIHGRLDLLSRLLDILKADDASRPSADITLIYLGDLIDRGPDSRGVVSRVRSGVDWARTVPLMGNHESVMLSVLDGDKDMLRSWLRFGGRETLLSWGVHDDTITGGTLDELIEITRKVVTPEERGWISRMRSHMRIGDYYFVHAGIRPGKALDKQTTEDQMWIRSDFLDSRRDHGVMIVHGHTVFEHVMELPNRISMDTGAYATGRLTAMGVEGQDRWFHTTD